MSQAVHLINDTGENFVILTEFSLFIFRFHLRENSGVICHSSGILLREFSNFSESIGHIYLLRHEEPKMLCLVFIIFSIN